MQKLLSIIGSFIFQFFFAAVLAVGALGSVYCVREWCEESSDDAPRERRLDIETDIAPFRSRKALGNIVSGTLCLIAGVGGTLIQIQFGRDVVSIPVVLISVGAVQLTFGVWQLVRRH